MKKTEYRVIAVWPHNGREHVAFKSSHGVVATLKQEFEWASVERYLGEFVRVERREKIITKTEWEEVK